MFTRTQFRRIPIVPSRHNATYLTRQLKHLKTHTSTPLRNARSPIQSTSKSEALSTPSGRPWSQRILISLNFVLLVHLFLTHVASLRPTRGPSMLPTFDVFGDWALISKLHRRGRWIRVGDMVSFDNPVRGPMYSTIKRIVGMPGDFVLRDTPVERDDVEQVMVQVPEGHVYVVGDNLPWSRDSRHFGPVPMALVKGKVMAKTSFSSGMTWFGGGQLHDGVPVATTREGFCDAGRKGARWAGDGN